MALELPLLPETLPEDVEDVSWGLQTAAALWSRGDKNESVVWVKRAAEAARGAGQEERAQTLLRSAGDLEALLASSPPSSVLPSDEPLRVLPPVGSAPVVAPPAPLAAMAAPVQAPPVVAPPVQLSPLERNVTQEIEDFESLDPEAAEDLFSEEETHELGAGEPLPNKPISSAPSSPPAVAAQAAVAAPVPVIVSGPSSQTVPITPHPSGVVITTKPDSPSPAGNKKRQREPILDPWSDDMPPSDPPPRTQHQRPELPSDDDDVMTSAPVLDVSLKRKPPPPPPKPRSQTLTGQPIPSGTVLAEASPDSVRPGAERKPDSPAASGVDGRPPPPPTRKPTTPSMQAVSFPAAVSDPANAPPPPSRERKSVPPPPPTRAPLHTQPLVPDAEIPSPAPPTPEPSNEPPTATAAAIADVKSEPPPPTMPAAQQRQSRPEQEDLLSAIDLPKESLPKEPLTPSERAQVAAPPEPPPPAPAAPPPVTARAPSIPPPPPRAPSRPPPRPASAPPPAVSPPPPITRPRTTTIPPAQRSVGGLSLDQVDVLSDLSGEIQKLLCDGATIVELGIEEEVAVMGAAIVLSGTAAVCPTVADAAASHLAQAALVPGLSTLAEPTRIRVVATSPATIASWDRAQLETALKSCPWVLEDLQRHGDRLSALAGATMGALGDLDEGSRLAAFERLTLRVLAPSEVLVAAGGELGGLNVVGAGAIIVANADGPIEFSVGDVVLPETVLEGGTTAGEIRAGQGGALLLTASRMVTVELFSILPSLIELLR